MASSDAQNVHHNTGVFSGARFEGQNIYNAQSQHIHVTDADRDVPQLWERVFDWLISSNHELNSFPKQRSIHAKQHKNTNAWFFNTPAYKSWSQSQSYILGCWGRRGTGKTVLMSTLIDELQQHAAQTDSKEIVLFQYLSPQFPENETQFAIMLLAQTLQCTRKVSEDLEEAFKYHRPLKTTPAFPDEILKLTMAQVYQSETIQIVMDALDEVPSRLQRPIINYMLTLRGLCSDGDKVTRFVFTSYNEQIFKAHMPQYMSFELVASNDDLKTFLCVRLENSTMMTDLTGKNSPIIHDLADQMVQKADGMFLLAALHSTVLESSSIRTLTQLRHAVDDLTPILENLYSTIWEQILSQDAVDVKIAREIILWIAFARGRIRTHDVQHAVALSDLSCTQYAILSEEDLISETLIEKVTKGLVVREFEEDRFAWLYARRKKLAKSKSMIVGSRRVLTFMHTTAAEFFPIFLRRELKRHPDLHITDTLLKQLQALPAMLEAYSEADNSFYPTDIPLLDYNLNNFAFHAIAGGEEKLFPQMRKIFADLDVANWTGTVLRWFRVVRRLSRLANEPCFFYDVQSSSTWMNAVGFRGTLLHLSCGMGLPRTVTKCLALGADIEELDNQKWTPMHWAIIGGDLDMIQLLREKNAYVDWQDLIWGFYSRYWMGMDEAVFNHKDTRNKCIFNSNTTYEFRSNANVWNGNNPDVCREMYVEPSRSFYRPELATDINTNADFFQLLLEFYMPSELQKSHEAIHQALPRRDFAAVIIALLEKQVQPFLRFESVMNSANNRVHINDAVFNVEELFIGMHLQVDMRDWIEACNGAERRIDHHIRLPQLLLSPLVRYCNKEQRDGLSIAAELGILDTVQRILASGPIEESRDEEGRTALMAAVSRPGRSYFHINRSVFNVDKMHIGARVEIRGNINDMQALHSVRSDPFHQRKAEITRILLEAGASLDARDHYGRTVVKVADLEDIFEVRRVIAKHLFLAAPETVNLVSRNEPTDVWSGVFANNVFNGCIARSNTASSQKVKDFLEMPQLQAWKHQNLIAGSEDESIISPLLPTIPSIIRHALCSSVKLVVAECVFNHDRMFVGASIDYVNEFPTHSQRRMMISS